MKEKKILKFVDQGGYGCIFRPEVVCGKNKLGNQKFVSKIYRYSDDPESDIQKEKYISSIIMKIPNHTSFFVPIIKTCKVNLREYKKSPELHKCDIMSNDHNENTDEYTSAKMRYVSTSLEKQLNFLVDNMLEPDFVRKYIQTFNHLKLALQKCIKAGFIHYDVKLGNMLYDETTHSPLVIDYGISVVVKQLQSAVEDANVSALQDIFYTKKFYLYWCIDIYIISQFLHHDYDENHNVTIKNEYLSNQKLVIKQEFLEKVIDDYLSEYERKMNSTNTKILKESYLGFYKQFVGQPWFNILKTCVTQKWYTSWDYYALCLTYLDLYNELASRRTYLSNNKTLQDMAGKWETVIKSDPLHRMD